MDTPIFKKNTRSEILSPNLIDQNSKRDMLSDNDRSTIYYIYMKRRNALFTNLCNHIHYYICIVWNVFFIFNCFCSTVIDIKTKINKHGTNILRKKCFLDLFRENFQEVQFIIKKFST